MGKVRVNTPLVIFGNAKGQRTARANPHPSGDVLIGKHVQAVIYIHARDDEPYVHGFGDADIKLTSIRAGDIRVKGLHEDTDVEMYGCADGSVRLVGVHDQPLWAMHKV